MRQRTREIRPAIAAPVSLFIKRNRRGISQARILDIKKLLGRKSKGARYEIRRERLYHCIEVAHVAVVETSSGLEAILGVNKLGLQF